MANVNFENGINGQITNVIINTIDITKIREYYSENISLQIKNANISVIDIEKHRINIPEPSIKEIYIITNNGLKQVEKNIYYYKFRFKGSRKKFILL